MSDPVFDVKCPRCGVDAPLTDWDEVDVGVGVIRGNERWECPDHGEFMFYLDDSKPTGQRATPMFRDEVSPFASEGLDES